MKLLSYIIAIGITLMLISCQKDIDLDFQNFESNLVVNGIFNSEDQWKVDVSSSANLLDVNSYIQKIDDAYVTIQDLNSGEVIELVHTIAPSNKGSYYSASVPKEFVDYKLSVEKEGYKTATAINAIPSEIDVVFLDTSLVEVEGELALKVDFKINDNGDEENFYVWDLLYNKEEEQFQGGGGTITSGILPSDLGATLESVDDNAEILNEESNVQSKLFISDHTFNGAEYNTTFLTYNDNIVSSSNPGSPNQSADLELQLRVLAVSRDLYDYLKSLEASYRSQNINTSNINPVDIDFNVDGGLGIFGAYKMHIIDIK